jgi:hypothetical protein
MRRSAMGDSGVASTAAFLLLGALVACGGGGEAAGGGAGQAAPGAGDGAAARGPEPASAPACVPSPRMALEGRASPYDSATFQVGGATGQVCYGRPSAAGRTMLGGDIVPHGRLWRTGANEPTILHLPVASTVAGVEVAAGSYSLYTVPGPDEWEVVVNRATSQWGHESQYPSVAEQEAGRGRVPAERLEEHVETFTIRAEPAGAGSDLVLEWEHTRVRIPVRPAR